jgi:hypothetical protein
MKTMYSLTEMAQEIERQNAAKIDYLSPTDAVHFVTTDDRSEVDLSGTDVTGLRLNDVAHNQLAARLRIPRPYYERIRSEVPVLLDESVNRLLRHHPGKDAPKWMWRTLDGTARAVLSDAYRRLDHFEIASAILPILQTLPGVEIRSCALTDVRMHIKAVTSIEGKVNGSREVGDIVRAGVYVGNSEVGYGSVTVFPFVERLTCTNGMVSTVAGDGMMKQIHLGRRVDADGNGRIFRDETRKADDHAFILALGDVVRAACDEARFHELVAEMSRATEGERIGDVTAAVEVLARREGLGETESKGILQHLAEGGDLSRWGLLNAVTRTAEDVESYDRATELETLGGKILAYSSRDWSALTTVS